MEGSNPKRAAEVVVVEDPTPTEGSGFASGLGFGIPKAGEEGVLDEKPEGAEAKGEDPAPKAFEVMVGAKDREPDAGEEREGAEDPKVEVD